MKISVITACFNCEKTIERTIKSVIEQNYPDIEYILIDGGSTDNTMKIVEKYEKYFSVIVSEKDKGVADGFNKGVIRATGDIIGIVNADDTMYPGTAVRLAKEYEEGIDAYYGDHIVIDAENHTKCYQKAKPLDTIKYCLPFSHQSIYISKKCYDKFGLYSLDYKLCLDYDLILKMYKGGAKFKYIPMAFCEYSFGGCTYVNPKATVNECTQIAMKYGLSKFEARKHKIKFLTLCYGKKVLSKIGLLHIAQKIRQKFNKRLNYSFEE